MKNKRKKGPGSGIEQTSRRFLLATAFVSGMSIMALEMSASRLLAPFFGTSLFVWTNIIGITMISLSVGYYIGGRIADKRPDAKILFSAIAATGLFSILIPFLSPYVMGLSAEGIRTGSAGIFYGSLLSSTLFFAPPIATLGGVSPFIIRLTIKDKRSSGFTAGSVFAVSTVGSIIGTFIPVILTIPFLGTRKTILLFGLILVGLGLFGLGKRAQIGLFSLLITATILLLPTELAQGTLYEKESVHNHIRVVEKGNVRYLRLNEGYAYHSIYDPDSILVNGVWDYFNLLPLLNPGGKRALIIGLAGGTIAREYRNFFPGIKIDGVEIDGEILEIGNRYFDMEGPNLSPYHMDGRTFLAATDNIYDFVIIDAYKQPYIPFHLTTEEFFLEVKHHLETGGIVAINVASLSPDSKVLLMIENTMAKVFEHVYVLHPEDSLNYIVFGSQKEIYFEIGNPDPLLKRIVSEAVTRHRQIFYDKGLPVLTDDKAPVETYTDLMIFYYIRGNDTRRYTQLFE